MESWRLLVSPAETGAHNLAADQAVAEHVRDGALAAPPCASIRGARPPSAWATASRWRRWIPTWPIAAELTSSAARPAGQAILHNDELTYAVMLPRDHEFAAGGVLASYARLSTGFERGVCRPGSGRAPGRMAANRVRRRRGGVLCFASPSTHELSAQGVKLMGSAQTRLGGALLQHGSIPFAHDPRIFDLLRLAATDGAAGTPRPPVAGPNGRSAHRDSGDRVQRGARRRPHAGWARRLGA